VRRFAGYVALPAAARAPPRAGWGGAEPHNQDGLMDNP
jgi:hypothetical protein